MDKNGNVSYPSYSRTLHGCYVSYFIFEYRDGMPTSGPRKSLHRAVTNRVIMV